MRDLKNKGVFSSFMVEYTEDSLKPFIMLSAHFLEWFGNIKYADADTLFIITPLLRKHTDSEFVFKAGASQRSELLDFGLHECWINLADSAQFSLPG